VGKTYCITVTITTGRMLNKRELYNEIIRLRQEGKTYREISKILHVSPSQISDALKMFEGTIPNLVYKLVSYRMFLNGRDSQ
jgi:hypothetical protein